ncbi:hypothetical protein [Rhodoblastus sp.]|uniref:hypothetical protein n=1 Tax=Rhodoblastus sp. TaxID=1962975 RepID=UPI003F994B2F
MSRVRIAVFSALAVFCAPDVALAQGRTCESEIARLQALVDQAQAGGQPVEDVKEGTFATLHHQPTAASVLAADKDALAKAKNALDRAKAYRAKGKNAACLKALDEVPY